MELTQKKKERKNTLEGVLTSKFYQNLEMR